MRAIESEQQARFVVSGAVPSRVLQLYCLLLFVVPSTTIIKAVGAVAFPASLVGLIGLALWAIWTLLGQHNPLTARSPVRVAAGALWVATLLSFASMQFQHRSVVEVSSADRWLILLAALSGVMFLASECLVSLDDVKRVLRALTWGGGFCGAVAAIQYWLHYNLTPVLGRALPGFSSQYATDIEFRNGLSRVAGTTLHPIELGSTAAMLMPLAVYLAIHDRDRPARRRLVPVLLIGASWPLSVSRSAILAVLVALGLLIVLLPPRARMVAFAAIPAAVAGFFATVPGLIATFVSLFGAAGRDTSITTRIDDIPLVEELVRRHPWFGQGGGSYVASNFFEILDNTYYKWMIEFGLVGLFLLVVFFFLIPMAAAFAARKRAQGKSSELAMLSAALGCGVASAAVSSFTFDSLAFPTYTCVLVLLIGLIGACWRLTGPPAFGRGTRGRIGGPAFDF